MYMYMYVYWKSSERCVVEGTYYRPQKKLEWECSLLAGLHHPNMGVHCSVTSFQAFLSTCGRPVNEATCSADPQDISLLMEFMPRKEYFTYLCQGSFVLSLNSAGYM